ncbi:MAG: hypothetical protein PHN80_09020 [Hespellia sp.]|nr:hypothetical protein [Hespellia sp.]
MSAVAVNHKQYVEKNEITGGFWSKLADKFIDKFAVDEKNVPEYKNDGTYTLFPLSNK